MQLPLPGRRSPDTTDTERRSMSHIGAALRQPRRADTPLPELHILARLPPGNLAHPRPCNPEYPAEPRPHIYSQSQHTGDAGEPFPLHSPGGTYAQDWHGGEERGGDAMDEQAHDALVWPTFSPRCAASHCAHALPDERCSPLFDERLPAQS